MEDSSQSEVMFKGLSEGGKGPNINGVFLQVFKTASLLQ